jgi:hypothetical protein
MQDWQEWTDIHGTPLEPDQAWRMFDDWKTAQKEIGLRFISGLSRFPTLELCARSAKEPFRSVAIPRRPRSI